MNTIPTYRTAAGRLVIALVLGFVMSCASAPVLLPTPTDETAAKWNATVDKHIADAQRASRLKQLGQQLFALQDSLAREVAGLSERAVALNVDYNSTQEDARQLVSDFTQKRNVALAQYRDIVFAMRREVSAQEWKALNQ